MSSERRIQSSRANGAKSLGPKTPAGKLRSSRNSLRHGILAQTVVLHAECAESFTTLLATLERQLLPSDQVEQGCVENMAVARWRMMRLWGMEKAGLEFEIGKQNLPTPDPATSAALAFRTLCDQSRSVDLLNRYETRYDRQYSRALNLLIKWRTGALPVDPAPGPCAS